jgi:hypothetical protein
MAVTASANALTDITAAKEYLKIGSSTTNDDNLIQGLINACSTAIENYCRRSFKTQIYSEYYDGTGTKSINLKNYPVTAVSAVAIDGVTVANTSYICKTDQGVLVRKAAPIPGLRIGANWPIGDWNIKVDYTGGYATIPADVELACKMFVAAVYKADIAAFSTTFNDGFVFKSDAIPVQVKFMLQPYVDMGQGVN